ncbi:putative Methane/phenol/toluene hydroxylase (monooxygenase) [Bradyrhizobium sp. ORS 375]|uniref:toluene hydroxylase n=1 Tax=Bradyrhizobium sp. (strain ORS 375) TaxID=566679 RepID=UPI00024080AB|nr:toluene hydroxylase [Bradyrhizobium sp. ORS 375]CCD96093.1 putative Methane/phenol/toluene hydroxylase (monooxygenase) [Bradyrhizobium sp. ORS 375]
MTAMTAKPAARKQKKTWSLWSERRLPSEYEAVTYKFHSHFRRAPAPFELSESWPVNQFYLRNREGSRFNLDDWEGFRDPLTYTYRRYVGDQKDREVYCDNLIDEFERQDSYRKLPAAWLDFLGQAYLPVRFPGHAMQMSAAYVAQMAPSAFVTNTFYFQMGNEMRRVQRQAYLAKALALDSGRPKLADSDTARAIWTQAPHWQGLRELIEKQLIAYDWGEAFVSRNLVLRPIFDHIFNREIAELARANDDDLLALLHDDFRSYDEAYAVETTKALVAYATGKVPAHANLLREWIAKWQPLGERAARGLSEALSVAPGAHDAQTIHARTMTAQARLVAECGL